MSSKSFTSPSIYLSKFRYVYLTNSDHKGFPIDHRETIQFCLQGSCSSEVQLLEIIHTATMCTLFSIFFRATEQAQTYLKIWVWHPIKHVFVPACSSVQKVHLFTFLWFWNSRYVISPKICPCILPFFPKYAPSSSSSSLGHSRPSASLSTTNIVDLLSTIIVLF